jgi:hypothetical protein
MPFELLATTIDVPGGKDSGENILLADLSNDYKVYAFYYPGQPVDSDFEDKLRELGKQTGKNLLINIGRYSDPQFDRIVKMFGIKKYPVLVMTALKELAASEDDNLTAYARLDSEQLFNSPDRALSCIEGLFNLFLQGKVAEAVSHAKWAQRAEVLRVVSGVVGAGLAKIANLVFDRDVVISFATFKLELKKKGGS